LLACTRCGHWHTSAETALERPLSCTEVKQFWGRLKAEHRELYEHAAQITLNDNGTYICFQCKREIPLNGSPVSRD
jgi:uncharacterized CHY-type Zn-finger protein